MNMKLKLILIILIRIYSITYEINDSDLEDFWYSWSYIGTMSHLIREIMLKVIQPNSDTAMENNS